MGKFTGTGGGLRLQNLFTVHNSTHNTTSKSINAQMQERKPDLKAVYIKNKQTKKQVNKQKLQF